MPTATSPHLCGFHVPKYVPLLSGHVEFEVLPGAAASEVTVLRGSSWNVVEGAVFFEAPLPIRASHGSRVSVRYRTPPDWRWGPWLTVDGIVRDLTTEYLPL
jgi:hypothetical protein